MGRIAIALLLLLIGAAIYLLFRDHVFFIEKTIGISEGLSSYRYQKGSLLSYLLIYCLPDGLWYMSLLLLHSLIRIEGWIGAAISILFVSLPFILEIAQLAGMIPGVFDVFDIITYVVSLIIVLLWLKRNC